MILLWLRVRSPDDPLVPVKTLDFEVERTATL
jgi:hypothetical protein